MCEPYFIRRGLPLRAAWSSWEVTVWAGLIEKAEAFGITEEVRKVEALEHAAGAAAGADVEAAVSAVA